MELEGEADASIQCQGHKCMNFASMPHM